MLSPGQPKAMALIAGRPFIDHQLASLREAGVERVILSLGYGAEAIEEFVADGSAWDLEITYTREERPLGTGGAIASAWALVRMSETAIVLNGDTMTTVPLRAMLTSHQLAVADATIAITPATTSRDYASITHKDGWVVSFREKGNLGPGWISTGCYVISRSVVREIEKLEMPCSLETDVFSRLCTKLRIAAFEYRGFMIDIGVPDRLEMAQKLELFMKRADG